MGYTIYLHKNKTNNKVYIGQTMYEPADLNKRWKNGFGYRNFKTFFADIVQFGWNNFEHVALKIKKTE